ncbi:Protein kinase-like domain protein [Moelleriella libera RCEF 2490]|uniref:EKC/KEOPS complex subunit BUD32 n=1 Tax=Moelleriella libera RCEF 2490 TaxID=1081109 RepID=A0A168FCW7_9HYPO|nr:Protein kinase-like domain protein [Moelleriella libera RCEF 2490]
MIDPAGRLWAGSGSLRVGGPYTWHITDFDQRRHFSVTYCPPAPIEDVEGTEDICIAKLREHVDDLDTDVLGIRFSDPEGPISVSTEQVDDVTVYANCHPLSALSLPFPVKTIGFNNLTELDRMGPQVDLVTYSANPTVDGTANTKSAFKYWFMANGMFRKWYELQCWARLPRDHPHIVPFDAVVLDHVRGGIVGFTSVYIPGGTLKDTDATIRPFRLAWLQQLLSVVDDLNYRYGIMHQDIAARNLVVDEKQNLCIFDFNFSIMIKEHYSPERDDMKGVIFTLYEIITLDEHFRHVPHAEQDAEALLRLTWVKHPDVKLDSDVHEFRKELDTWIDKRRTREFKVVETCIQWPWMPPEPPAPVLVLGPDGRHRDKEIKSVPVLVRRGLVRMNEPFMSWERPASYQLKTWLEKNGRQREAGAPRTTAVQPSGESVDGT